MALIINGEKIQESLIEDEVARMRPEYQNVFKEQTPEEQEAQLFDWAKENIIERILIQQAAKNDPREIPDEEIDKAFSKLKEEHGGEEKFYDNIGLKKGDDDKIKNDLELQLRTERLLNDVTDDLPKPTEAQAQRYYDENREKFVSEEQVRAAHIVKHVDASTTPAQAKEAMLKVQQELIAGKSYGL